MIKIFVFIGLFLLSINSVLIQTVFNGTESLKIMFRMSALISVLIYIIFSNKKIKHRIIWLCILTSIFLVLSTNKDLVSYIYLFIILQSLLNLKEDKIVNFLFFSSLISFLMIFVFLKLGMTYNSVTEYRNRSTFGITGQGGATFFYNLLYGTLILGYFYVKQKKLNTKIYACLSLGLSIYFFIKTDVRGGFSCVVIFFITKTILKKIIVFKTVRRGIRNIPLILTLVAYVTGYVLNNAYFNKLLSFRPVLYKTFFNNINFFDYLFSTSVKKFDGISIVDNSYIHILIGGGIFIYIYHYVLYRKTINSYIKLRQYDKMAFFISVSAYLFLESLIVRIENMFILYYWYLIFINNRQIKGVKNEKINSISSTTVS